MAEAYQVHDGQYISQAEYTSAANGLTALVGPVPVGKVWTILSARCSSDIAETQAYWFCIRARTGTYYPVTLPADFECDPATLKTYPLLREGMEIKLFPGESIVGARDAAAVGSTITTCIRYIETDMPLYRYEEPQKEKMRQSFKRSIAGAVSGITAPAAPSRPGGMGRPPLPPREK